MKKLLAVLFILLIPIVVYARWNVAMHASPGGGIAYDYAQTAVETDSSYDMGIVHALDVDGSNVRIGVIEEIHGDTTSANRILKLVEVTTDDLTSVQNSRYIATAGLNIQSITHDDNNIYFTGFDYNSGNSDMIVGKVPKSDWSTDTIKHFTGSSNRHAGQFIVHGVDFSSNPRLYIVGNSEAATRPAIWSVDPSGLTHVSNEGLWHYSNYGLWYGAVQDSTDKAVYAFGYESNPNGVPGVAERYGTLTKITYDVNHDPTISDIDGVHFNTFDYDGGFSMILTHGVIDSADGNVIWAVGNRQTTDGYNGLLVKFDITTTINVTACYEIDDASQIMTRMVRLGQDGTHLYLSTGYIPHDGQGDSDESTNNVKHSGVVAKVTKADPSTVLWAKSFGGKWNSGLTGFIEAVHSNGHLYAGGWTDGYDSDGTVRAIVSKIDIDSGGNNNKYILYESSNEKLSQKRYTNKITITQLTEGVDFDTFDGDGKSAGTLSDAANENLATFGDAATFADRSGQTTMTGYTYDYTSTKFYLRPLTENDINLNNVAGADYHWQAVDDLYGADDADYVSNGTQTFEYDLHASDFNAADASGISISQVDLYYRAGTQSGSSNGEAKATWKIGGESRATGATNTVGSTATNHNDTVTNAAWTTTELENTVFGTETRKTGIPYCRTYQTYLQITYSE